MGRYFYVSRIFWFALLFVQRAVTDHGYQVPIWLQTANLVNIVYWSAAAFLGENLLQVDPQGSIPRPSAPEASILLYCAITRFETVEAQKTLDPVLRQTPNWKSPAALSGSNLPIQTGRLCSPAAGDYPARHVVHGSIGDPVLATVRSVEWARVWHTALWFCRPSELYIDANETYVGTSKRMHIVNMCIIHRNSVFPYSDNCTQLFFLRQLHYLSLWELQSI